MKKYDVIVIGMGPAGMAISSLAHAAGLSVLAIERNKVGGECLNCGCIPSKAILKAAEIKKSGEDAHAYGIDMDVRKIGDVLGTIRHDIKNKGQTKASQMFSKIDTLVGKGTAEFIDPHTIKVKDDFYYGNNIFIAAGSEPFVPNIEGIETVPFMTNKNLFDLENIPETLTIIGGGAIACEMAQAFQRLGAKVHMINMDSHLMPAADKDISCVLEKEFKKEGIDIHNSTIAKSVYQKNDVIYVKTDKEVFSSERLLIAAGRKPSIEYLKLEKAGVLYTKSGITVDEFNRTNIGHIYAVGDCNGKFTFSHAAMHQGMLSTMHMLGLENSGDSLKRSDYLVPWAIFTEPEIAHVGISEKDAIKSGIKYMVVKDYYENYGRTMIDKKTAGFIKVITDQKGKIYGVSIIGNGAGELISEWTLAIQHNLSVRDIAMMQHPFPTLSLMNSRVAQKWLMQAMSMGKKEEQYKRSASA